MLLVRTWKTEIDKQMYLNRYYILPVPNNHSQLWDIVVGTEETQRYNNLNNKMVVKLYMGDDTNHAILNGFTEYTHAEIITELEGSEWNNEII